MSYSKNYRLLAIALRRRGYSYSEISSALKVPKSTAYEWSKKTQLNSKAKNRIERIMQGSRKRGNNTKKNKKQIAIKESEVWAKYTLKSLPLTPNLARVYCSLLYWGEGGKFTDNRLEFTNSDPQMIKTFLRMLRFGFKVDEKKLRANIHLHEYHNGRIQKLFWHQITKIPISQFNKSYLKPHTKKVIRPNYQGCVRIIYYSGITTKKIKALYQQISEI